MYTESEAKKLWCPMARMWNIKTSSGLDALIAGYNEGKEDAKCTASDCMMWRWMDGETAFREVGYMKKDAVSNSMVLPSGEGWIQSSDFPQTCYRLHPEKRRGYCGLAPLHY